MTNKKIDDLTHRFSRMDDDTQRLIITRLQALGHDHYKFDMVNWNGRFGLYLLTGATKTTLDPFELIRLGVDEDRCVTRMQNGKEHVWMILIEDFKHLIRHKNCLINIESLIYGNIENLNDTQLIEKTKQLLEDNHNA